MPWPVTAVELATSVIVPAFQYASAITSLPSRRAASEGQQPVHADGAQEMQLQDGRTRPIARSVRPGGTGYRIPKKSAPEHSIEDAHRQTSPFMAASMTDRKNTTSRQTRAVITGDEVISECVFKNRSMRCSGANR